MGIDALKQMWVRGKLVMASVEGLKSFVSYIEPLGSDGNKVDSDSIWTT